MERRPYRGVYAIPVTPFTETGSLDEDGLAELVDFTIAAGAHGLVAPVNASEFSALSDSERVRVVEVVATQNSDRLPFVAGVSGVSVEVAVGFARHASDRGASAIMAMPPYVRKPRTEEIKRYYQGISDSVDVPIFVQNYPLPVGVPMTAGFLAELARDIEHVLYIKEELPPVTHSVSADISACGDLVEGVFGGAAGKHMMNEMLRGVAGTMPACDVTDLHAAVWDTYSSGDVERATEVFHRLLPLLNFESLYGVNAYKEVLKRRGVIKSAYVRASTIKRLDEKDHVELDRILSSLEDLFSL
jgi:dihydrodipicolinate synthase/N-acetylneuraminate lyase